MLKFHHLLKNEFKNFSERNWILVQKTRFYSEDVMKQIWTKQIDVMNKRDEQSNFFMKLLRNCHSKVLACLSKKGILIISRNEGKEDCIKLKMFIFWVLLKFLGKTKNVWLIGASIFLLEKTHHVICIIELYRYLAKEKLINLNILLESKLGYIRLISSNINLFAEFNSIHFIFTLFQKVNHKSFLTYIP